MSVPNLGGGGIPLQAVAGVIVASALTVLVLPPGVEPPGFYFVLTTALFYGVFVYVGLLILRAGWNVVKEFTESDS